MTARRKRAAGGRGGAAPAGLKISQLAQALSKGELDRLYLCLGEEILLARRALQLVEAVVVTEANRVWGKDELVAGESGAADIVRATTQAPMLGGHRLVVVREIDRLRKADKEVFPQVLDRVPDTTVVMMTATKLDGRTAFSRELKRRCTVVACEPLADEVIPMWIEHELAERYPNLSMDRDAVARLHLLAGTDLSVISGELEKLSHFIGKRKKITVEDVDQVVAGGTAASLADLVDAVGDRDVARALASLTQVLDAGTSPVQILAFLGFRLHDLWRASDTMNHSGTWFRGDVKRQVRRYDAAELRKAAVTLFEADQRLKTSSGSPRVVLETLVRRVAGGEAAAGRG